jgi:hypothetical protein
MLKWQRLMIPCFSGVRHRFNERTVAKILGDSGVVWSSAEYFVAFPAAQCDRANLQSASGLRLKDFQLDGDVAANGRRWCLAPLELESRGYATADTPVRDTFTTRSQKGNIAHAA